MHAPTRWMPTARPVLLLALLGPFISPHAASLMVNGYADTNLDPTPPATFGATQDPATVGSSLGNDSVQNGGTFGAAVVGRSSARAAFGDLGVLVEAKATGPAPFPTSTFVLGEAGASAGWSDSFRIIPADNALIGTALTFNFIVTVTGTGDVSPFPDGPSPDESGLATYSVQLDMTFCEVCDLTASGQWNYNLLSGNATTTFQGDPLGTQLGGMVRTGFGSLISVGALLVVSAQAVDGSDPGSVRSSVNLLNTLRWGGISDLRDSQGNVVTEYIVVSESGTDWRQPAAPVPVPAALWLFATGFGALLSRKHKADLSCRGGSICKAYAVR